MVQIGHGRVIEAGVGDHEPFMPAVRGQIDRVANQIAAEPAAGSHDTFRIAWAKLMARVGEEFPLECPNYGGDIRLIAFITEPGPIRKILKKRHVNW